MRILRGSPDPRPLGEPEVRNPYATTVIPVVRALIVSVGGALLADASSDRPPRDPSLLATTVSGCLTCEALAPSDHGDAC